MEQMNRSIITTGVPVLAAIAIIVPTGLLTGCASPLAEYEAEIPPMRSVSPEGSIAGAGGESHSSTSGAGQSAGNNQDAALPVIVADSSLVDCLRYAALENKGLESAYYAWRSAVEQSPQVTALPDPRFTYGYFINEVETRIGPQQHRLQFAQTLPWFNKLNLRGEVADANARAAYERFEGKKVAVFDRVRRAYDELFYLRRAITLTGENLELLRQFEGVATQKYRVGMAQYADVIRVQVEIGKLEDRLLKLKDLRSPLTANLNAALNRSPNAEVPWPDDISDETLDADESQILTWLGETNPELIALDEEMNRERLRSRLAKLDYYPDVTLGMTYVVTNHAVNPNLTESGDDAVLASVSINVPIHPEKYSAGVRQAIANRLSKAKAKEDRRDRLNAEVKQAIFQHDDAQRRIGLYRDTLVPKARESLKASLAGFEGGKTRFLDLIDTERTLLEFELLFERARADRANAISQLERLVGKTLPTKVPGAGTGSDTKQNHPENEMNNKESSK